MTEPQGSVTRYEFFKWLTDVTLPFASCPLVIGDLSESVDGCKLSCSFQSGFHDHFQQTLIGDPVETSQHGEI
jgi:hypothetical protein